MSDREEPPPVDRTPDEAERGESSPAEVTPVQSTPASSAAPENAATVETALPAPPRGSRWDRLRDAPVDESKTLEAHLEARSSSLLEWLRTPQLFGSQFRLSTAFGLMVAVSVWFFCWRNNMLVFMLLQCFLIFGSCVVLLDENSRRRDKGWAAVVLAFALIGAVVLSNFAPETAAAR